MLQQWLCHLASWTQQEALDFGATCYFFSLRGRLKSTWKLFKWNSCLSGCHGSWSFETDAFFEKKKNKWWPQVSNPSRHRAVWDASSEGWIAACSCLLHALQSLPGARLAAQILLTESVRIWIIWGFFLKLFPRGPSCLKNRTSKYTLQPALPREKIKF